MLSNALFLLPLLASAGATPLRRGVMALHESVPGSPDGFSRVGAATGGDMLTLRLALKPNNVAGLQAAAIDIATPGSANYGKFLSLDEVNAFVKPSAATTAAVTAFLKENGLEATTVSPAGDWLEFQASVKTANEVFAADFSVFRHDDTGTQGIRTLAYSVPSALSDDIVVLQPGTSFWNPESAPTFTAASPSAVQSDKKAPVPASCNETITPVCLQDLYGIPTKPVKANTNNLAVSGFIQQFANNADLQQFLTMERPDLVGTTFGLQTLDNGTNPQDIGDAGIEANLDIQYTVGLANKLPVTFVSVGDANNDNLNGFLDIVNFFLQEKIPPHTFTTSYGQNENTVSPKLAATLCNAYAALGARGTSILFASGDGGVGGSRQSNCTQFVPTFPSGCPFMTSVGATMNVPETSAPFSSGGFSDVFDRLPFQDAAVKGYFKELGDTNKGLFNRKGRAYPDVSAMGNNVLITFQTEVGTVGGTSCSSPILASIIAQLNNRLIHQGRPPLGFLNPFLYLNSHAFTDITTGSNPGCGGNGFPALKGWDPVTGVGSPNFGKLARILGV